MEKILNGRKAGTAPCRCSANRHQKFSGSKSWKRSVPGNAHISTDRLHAVVVKLGDGYTVGVKSAGQLDHTFGLKRFNVRAGGTTDCPRRNGMKAQSLGRSPFWWLFRITQAVRDLTHDRRQLCIRCRFPSRFCAFTFGAFFFDLSQLF